MFVSEEGAEVVNGLRVSAGVSPTGGRPPVELLASIPSEECGCPEEIWRIDGLLVLAHFEADGSSEIFIIGGDWEEEYLIQCSDMAHLRAEMFRTVAELEDEG